MQSEQQVIGVFLVLAFVFQTVSHVLMIGLVIYMSHCVRRMSVSLQEFRDKNARLVGKVEKVYNSII